MAKKYKKLGGNLPRYPNSPANDETFKVTFYRKTLMESIEESTNEGWCDVRDLELELGCNTAKNYETFEFCVRAGVIRQDSNQDYLFCITNFGFNWMQKKKDNNDWYQVKVKEC